MQLADFYRECFKITDESLLREVVRISRTRKVKAGETLFKQGQIPTQLCLLMQGVVRGFLLNENGKDITDCIVFRCEESVMPDGEFWRPDSICIEALEDSEIVCVDSEHVKWLLQNHPKLIKLHEKLLIQSENQHRTLRIVAYQYTAAQRYQWFLQEYPGLIDRIQHKYIASLLNMTPVTLSKVRRELKERDAG